jgi:hypothetical protein
LVLVLSLALSLGGTDQPALAQSGQEPGNVVATVLPSVTQTDRRALLASFIDRLGPSCLEKGKQFGADPAALAATVWARGFYRTDDISETSGGWRASSITPIGTFVPGSASTTRRPILLSTTSPQSGSVEAFSLGAYARRDGRIIFVDGAVAVTYATLDSTQNLGGKTATDDSDATGAGVVAGIGLVLHARPLTLEPRIGLDYDHNRQAGFTERGVGTANLHIGGEDRDALRSNVGTRLHTVWELASGAGLMPEFSIAWALAGHGLQSRRQGAVHAACDRRRARSSSARGQAAA